MRRLVQLGFLALVVTAVFLVGGNAELWCPFGGIEALYTYLSEGSLPCSLGVSNFFILGGVLLTALLLRRAFCSYACPIGTLSEWIGKGAARTGLKPLAVPVKADRILSLFKYASLAVILFLTWRAGELIFRGVDPCYALLSRHGEDITFWAYVVSGAVVAGSLFVTIPFCRWLCPLAAMLNLFSRFGLTRIKRNTHACINCGKCAKECPVVIPVDNVKEVTAARCTSCFSCLAACPREGALAWGLPGKAIGSGPAMEKKPKGKITSALQGQAILVPLFLLILGGAVIASHLMPFPSFVWRRGALSPEASELELNLEELSCRGRANLLVYFLDRDDELELEGSLRLEAWPDPGTARVRILFDPSGTDETMIKMAITQPYFDYDVELWRTPPFEVEGFDFLGLDGLTD